jgi:hypothetical protein
MLQVHLSIVFNIFLLSSLPRVSYSFSFLHASLDRDKWPYKALLAPRRFRFSAGARISVSPPRPDRLWGPPSLLSSGYRG